MGGRTLRRRIYEIDDDTRRFDPEYSTVVGVPWSYVPPSGDTGSADPRDPVTTYTVGLVPGREEYRVRWPNVVEYDAFGGDEELVVGVEDWGEVPELELVPLSQRETMLGAALGPEETLIADTVGFRRVAFLAAAGFTGQLSRQQEGSAGNRQGCPVQTIPQRDRGGQVP